jgi:hypothetical protein
MIRYGNCPKCFRNTAFEVKYLPLIKVPYYAGFQPLETLAVCYSCNSAGIIKREMINKGIAVNGEFWTDKEAKKYKLKETT